MGIVFPSGPSSCTLQLVRPVRTRTFRIGKVVMRGKKKASKADGEEVPAAGVAGSPPQVFPELRWFLESKTWGDGKTARLTGGLSIFPQDGQLKACLRERGLAQVAFVTATGLYDLLQRVEAALASNQLDWRPDKFRQPERPSS